MIKKKYKISELGATSTNVRDKEILSLPKVVACRPSSSTGAEISLQRYDRTNLYQWHIRHSIMWDPVEPILIIEEVKPKSKK